MRFCIAGTLAAVFLSCGCAFASNVPNITSVNPITVQQYQTITIRGTGFGTQAPYTGDSPNIAFSDFTKVWEAGYIGPGPGPGGGGQLVVNAVTLVVLSWTDSDITLGGFAGEWGASNWTLDNGDSIGLTVTNPQSGLGPAYWDGVVVPQPVPEPGSLLMLGSGLLASIGAVRRRSC